MDAPPPGPYALVPLGDQVVTPGDYDFEANGNQYAVLLRQQMPSPVAGTSAVPPSATPSPTNTPSPTVTPSRTPTPTNTPILPEWPSPTPDNSQLTVTPATPVPGKQCDLKAKLAVRVRSTPSTSGAIVGTVGQGANIMALEFRAVGSYLWARHGDGRWSAVYNYGDKSWWFDVYESAEVCQDVPGWDTSISLPSPIAREIQVGLHVLVGANAAPIMATLGSWGLIKCLSSSWNICEQAKAAKPGIVTVYRTLTLGDCPGNWDSPDSWWFLQRQSWVGINADYYEFMNECIADWSQMSAFAIRMMELAAADGRCLLLFSFAPGNPATLDWLKLKPALDYALTHPCQPGRYHGVALHQPGYAPPAL